MHTKTKTGKHISEYRCKIVGKTNWKFIHMQTEGNYFPEWCPLENIEDESFCNCNTRIENE